VEGFYFIIMKKKIVFIIASICLTLNIKAQHYAPVGQGTLGGSPHVRGMFTDTVVDLLFVSGGFANGGGIGARGIASWDGINWDTVGLGLDNYPIQGTFPGYALAMCRYNNELYIGGGFNHADTANTLTMAHWDGTTWYPMPSEPNGEINSFMVYNNELYVGGTFDSVGNIQAFGLAKWNGSVWSDVHALPNYEAPFDINYIYCTAVYQGNLYVGGHFFGANGLPNIVYWNGSLWDTLPNGGIAGAGTAIKMVVYQNELYVGGEFSQGAGNAGNNIQKWNGTNWSDVGGGTGGPLGTVADMKIINNELYVVGNFYTAGGLPAQYIAKWDGTNWCSFGDTFEAPIDRIEVYHDTIYVGGAFLTINGDTMNHIAKWVGGNYTANCTTVGVNEAINDEEITIYPNPCEGSLTLTLSEGEGMKEVKIINVLGACVLEVLSLSGRVREGLDVSGLAKGLYFVEVYFDKLSNRGAVRKKIVKE